MTAIRHRAVTPSVSAYCRPAANWWPASARTTCTPLALTCVDEAKTVRPAIHATAYPMVAVSVLQVPAVTARREPFSGEASSGAVRWAMGVAVMTCS
jgi:hypothetical protein